MERTMLCPYFQICHSVTCMNASLPPMERLFTWQDSIWEDWSSIVDTGFSIHFYTVVRTEYCWEKMLRDPEFYPGLSVWSFTNKLKFMQGMFTKNNGKVIVNCCKIPFLACSCILMCSKWILCHFVNVIFQTSMGTHNIQVLVFRMQK